MHDLLHITADSVRVIETVNSVSNNPADIELSTSGEASYMQRSSFILPVYLSLSRLFSRSARVSISVQHEAGEGAVLVIVAPVRLSAVQLNINLVPGLQVKNHTVAGVVVVLVGVLGDGAGSHLKGKCDSL